MTTATTRQILRRRVVRPSHPFQQSDRALQACAFAPTSDDQLLAGQENYYMDPSFYFGPLRPRFQFNVDLAVFEQDTGLDPGSAELILTMRDFAIKEFKVLLEATLDAIPETWVAPDDINISAGQDPVEFSIFICLAKSLDPRPGIAYRLGSVLATKKFTLRPEIISLAFPVVATDFAARGWPEGALWRVEFLNDDYSLPADEVVTVHINEHSNLNLRRLLARSVTGELFARMLAADIAADVAFEVLGSEEQADPEDSEGQGIRSKLLIDLSESMNVGQEQILEIVKSGDLQWVRAAFQSMYTLSQSVASMDIRRLR